MATPSNRILVPQVPASSYNPDRPLVKNTLLHSQVRHFRAVEKARPALQSGVDFESIQTERQAAEYIRKMTALLHPRVLKAG